MGKRGAASFVALRLFRFESRDARAELVELGLELLENFVERFGELRKSDFLSFFRGSCCGDAMGLQPALGGLLEDFGRKGGNRMAGGARGSFFCFGHGDYPPTSRRASSARAVVRYRSPVLQPMVTINLPLFSGRLATSRAT